MRNLLSETQEENDLSCPVVSTDSLTDHKTRKILVICLLTQRATTSSLIIA